MTRQWDMTITIMDGKGQTSKVLETLETPDDISDPTADPAEYAQAYALALDDITTGKIVAISLNMNVPLPGGLQSTPSSDSDVEEGAKFTFRTNNGFKTHKRIPTFYEALMLSGTDTVDDTETVVEDFIDLVVAPEELAADWQVSPVDSRGDDITEFVIAKESFTKSRKD